MVLIPLKQSQQSKGAKPDPSAFCRNAISLAKLPAIKRNIIPAVRKYYESCLWDLLVFESMQHEHYEQGGNREHTFHPLLQEFQP
jgi:hypothetical protein